MASKSLTVALTLYRSGTLGLEPAARKSGLSPAQLTAVLRSRGIPVREDPPAEEFDEPAT